MSKYDKQANLQGSSHLNLVLAIEDLERLAILDDLCALLELELQKRIRDNTNSDVDGFNVILYFRDGLLDVREGSVVRELLARVVNLALHSGQAIIDLLQLRLQVLHVLANSSEAVLNVSELVCVSPVVSRHALEVSRQDRFFSRDFLEGSRSIVLQSLQLAANLG